MVPGTIFLWNGGKYRAGRHFLIPEKRRAPEGALNCLPQLLVPRPKA